jgi:hypothetical protein
MVTIHCISFLSTFAAVLNFGIHAVNPLKKVITKIYNPSRTTYGNYAADADGHILSGKQTRFTTGNSRLLWKTAMNKDPRFVFW